MAIPTSTQFSDFSGFIGFLLDLLNPVLALLAGVAMLVFVKGLVSFISKAGDAKSHEEGKSLMIWGLIALFVMVSVIGILRIIHNDLGFGEFGIPLLPTR